MFIKFKKFVKRLGKIKYFVILLFLCIFLSGCEGETALDKLKWLDNKVGEVFDDFEEIKNESMGDIVNNKADSDKEGEEEVADSITSEQKEKIDKWLSKKELNRYGDAKNAIYTGGTPLFNEETGEMIDRYDYILNKFPKILEIIEED